MSTCANPNPSAEISRVAKIFIRLPDGNISTAPCWPSVIATGCYKLIPGRLSGPAKLNATTGNVMIWHFFCQTRNKQQICSLCLSVLARRPDAQVLAFFLSLLCNCLIRVHPVAAAQVFNNQVQTRHQQQRYQGCKQDPVTQ